MARLICPACQQALADHGVGGNCRRRVFLAPKVRAALAEKDRLEKDRRERLAAKAATRRRQP